MFCQDRYVGVLPPWAGLVCPWVPLVPILFLISNIIPHGKARMTVQDKLILAMNRGVISSKGLARIDIERMAMSAEIQTNWMPRVLGAMMLRPGLEHIGNSSGNLKARQIPFTFGVDDTAQIEVTDSMLRVFVDDVLIERPNVTAVVANSDFVSLAAWTDRDESGAASTNPTDAVFGVVLKLVGTGDLAARRTQEISVSEPATEHALNIVVKRGVMTLRVGTAEHLDDYVSTAYLGMGEHSIAFTPAGNFWIELSATTDHEVLVKSCSIEPSGEMVLETPWEEADFPKLRWDQSGDVIYVACDGKKQMKIERRSTRSWSTVQYFPENGPFLVQNTTATTLTPSALQGQITITASKPVFKPEHQTNHSLFRIASSGQSVTDSVSADVETFTGPIRIVGSGTARKFGIIVEGTFSATATVQFGFSDDGPWNDLGVTYTAPISTNYDDGQDGQIIYYRIGMKSGDWTSGTMTFTLTYTGGSIEGIARINRYISSTSVDASVLKPFGSITASSDWWEGEWSARRGYPSAVALHEGRAYWAGLDKIYGSVSDDYENFDDNTVGDSAPISRSIGSGPHRVINWLMSMGRLLMGTSDNSHNIAPVKVDGNNPLGARSNAFDEPLTPTNFNIKTISSKGLFVDRTRQRLYELTYNLDNSDYQSLDLSVFTPDFNEIGIAQVAVQMKPDVRVHCVREDGTAGVLVFDRIENVICWIEITTPGASGVIEDVSVLPGVVEDQVYYFVKRTINGSAERHLCKWAMESECIGGALNKQADSFVTYTGAATTTPFTNELLHLRGETVVIWADGKDVGTDVVTAGGALTSPLAVAASNVVAGLGYTAQFKSTKLAELDGIGLLEHKKVNRIGFIAENLHYQSLQYGPDFNNLSDMPKEYQGEIQPEDTIYATYHEDNFPFGGSWNADSRICLQAAAPRPCTILAAIAEMQSLEKSTSRR